ncbi:MAG TPA: FG-GAP-like repeat-containing protein [Actinomycetota bacterium]|nr:FG-GAP-like repeat-containing protein [Actinomycetota bacterium]
MRRVALFALFTLFCSLAASGARASTPGTPDQRGKDLKTTEIPNDAGFIAAGGVTASGEGVVRIFTDADHNKSYEKLVQEFAPYGNAKVGDGVRVALGDFNGDTNEELVTASGGKTLIKVFELGSDGTVGNEVLSFGGFPKGAYVAAGDVNGDGRDELVVGSGKGASPTVVIRDDTTFSGTPSHVADKFLAYGSTFKGGVNVALGNTTNAGGKEVITAPASGKGKVKVLTDADADTQVSDGPVKESFFAYAPGFAGGVNVASGALDSAGNGGEEIVVAPASGTGKVRILTDSNSSGTVSDDAEFESFFPYGAGYAGGVRVAAGDTDGSGFFSEVVTESATGAGTRSLKIYDDDADAGPFVSDNPRSSALPAFPPSVTGGGYVDFGKVLFGVFTFTGFPQTIPDLGTLTTTITVPRSAGAISDLDVSFAAFHSFDGDLDVKLTHLTTGTSMFLFQDVGGTNEGFNIRLNDESGTDINSASNPKLDGEINGTFNPGGSALLSVFDGEDASGVWQLDVADDSGGDSGTLFGWTLYAGF